MDVTAESSEIMSCLFFPLKKEELFVPLSHAAIAALYSLAYLPALRLESVTSPAPSTDNASRTAHTIRSDLSPCSDRKTPQLRFDGVSYDILWARQIAASSLPISCWSVSPFPRRQPHPHMSRSNVPTVRRAPSTRSPRPDPSSCPRKACAWLR